MRERIVPPSERTLGAGVYGSLAGLIFLALVRRLAAAHVAALGDPARKWLDSESLRLGQLRKAVQLGSGLSDAVMADRVDAAFSDWRSFDAEQMGVWLCLYTGCLWPPDGDLDDREAVDSAARFGVDLQLCGLVDAMTRSAVYFVSDPADAAIHVVDALRIGADLGMQPSGEPNVAFRTWRLQHLPAWLRPDSPIEDTARAAIRTLDRELVRLMPEPGD